MKPVPPILTGQYLQAEGRDLPPKELMEAMGMPVPQALAETTAEEEES